jgi:hypothetical protein
MRHAFLLPFCLVASVQVHCAPGLRCGAGTHESSGLCVADSDATVHTDGDATRTDAVPPDTARWDALPRDVALDALHSPDASDARDSGTERDAAMRSDAGADASPCAAQCDCPSGTLCSISGVCVGTACTQRCTRGSDCPCGRACTGGYCDLPAGSLTPCTHNCECARGEECGNGRCVAVCGHAGGDCVTDNDCAACGKVCEAYAHRCTTRGQQCFCDGSCSAWGLDGQICDAATLNCALPVGTPLDFGAGAFVPASPPGGGSIYAANASTSAGGTTTRITLVADLDLSIDDAPLLAAVTAPDGSTQSTSLRWQCAGAGPTRWRVVIDLGASPRSRNGEWRIRLTDYPRSPTSPSSALHVWMYLG